MTFHNITVLTIWRGLGFPHPTRFRGVGRVVGGGEAFEFALAPKNTKCIGSWADASRDTITPYGSIRARGKSYIKMAQAGY